MVALIFSGLFGWAISGSARAFAQETDVVRKDLEGTGKSIPIRITSDHAATWEEKDDRVFLLQGNIRLEQGATRISAGRGAVWVDMKRKATSGSYYLHVYGEDGVEIVTPTETKRGPRGMVALTTTGEVSIKPTASKMADQNLTTDPAFVRAYEERNRVVSAARELAASQTSTSRTSASIQQTQATVPDVPPPPQPPMNLPPPPAPTNPPAPPVMPATPPGPPPTFDPGAPVPPMTPAPPPPPFFGPPMSPPPGSTAPPVAPTPRRFSIRPRTSEQIRVQNYTTPNGETVYVVPSPVIVKIDDPKAQFGSLDIEADRMVFWTRGDGKQFFENMKSNDGETSQHIELYLAGHVELRSRTKNEEEILRAEELYYDVSRNVAIGTKADLEIRQPKLPYPVHMRAPEILQLNSKVFQANNAEVFSTILPSDPGLKIYMRSATVEEVEVPKRGFLGRQIIDPATGLPAVERRRYFEGDNFLLYFENVPVFWFPYLRGDIEDPLGPLENISIGGSQMFGFQFQSTWDLYQLLGIQRPAGTRWRLYLDYLSARGPAAGTEFLAKGRDLFDVPNRYNFFFKAWGIYDPGYNNTRTDILGGSRGEFYFPPPPGTMIPFEHPLWRGRILSRANVQDLPDGFTVQSQLALISDQNFIEQYFLNEWLTDYNQETFLYVKQQQEQWAWNLLVEPRLRRWTTEASALPRADGWLLGQKLFDDWVTMNVRGSAGYFMLRTPDRPSYAYLPTDVNVDTGRFDLWSEFSLPFTAGPFRFAPYLVGDVAGYTADVNGDAAGRLYGGAGLRSTMPMSRLFPDVSSEFFNLDGLYHKIVFGTNYLYARTNVGYNELPQIDRLNDDTSDQAMRDLQYRQIFINPANAAFLTNFNGLVNPQAYLLRRMIDNRIDTLGDMNVVQFSVDQRLQTKRGIAASEHVVDWMNLNLGASFFPQPGRDNFGESWGILEYDWNWNVGDRTAFYSNGWMEPVTGGPRVFNVGAILNRPDGVLFSIGYRQIDPLESKAVVGSLTYRFSRKYAIAASTVWDYGVDMQTYGLGIVRTGTDVQMSLGISYNSVLQNFGVQFEIVPNLFRSQVTNNAASGNAYNLMSR